MKNLSQIYSWVFLLSLSLLHGCYGLWGEECYEPYFESGMVTSLAHAQSEDIHYVPSVDVTATRNPTKEGYKIEKLDGELAFAGNQFSLKELPLNDGERKTYSFRNQSFLLKDRPLKVLSATNGTILFSRNLLPFDQFAGWSKAKENAFAIYDAVSSDWLLYKNTSTNEWVPTSLGPNNITWIEGNRFLAQLGEGASYDSSSYGDPTELVRFLSDGSTFPAEVLYAHEDSPCQSLTPYLQAEDGTIRELGSVTWESGEYDSCGFSFSDTRINPDGTQVLVHAYGRNNPYFLIDLSSETTTFVDSDSLPAWATVPPRPSKVAFDGAFSSTIENETQSWNITITLTVVGKNESIANKSYSSEGDEIKYHYDLSVKSGDSSVTESGEFSVGFSPAYCSSNWD